MKVMCPKCGNLIDLSKDDKVGFCNECGNNFDPYDGKRALETKYKNLQNLAYKYTYTRGEFDKAIECYEESLTLKPNDFSSIVGICLNTINANKFDDCAFNKVEGIIEKYDISLNEENTFIYLNFVKDALSQISIFVDEAHSRLIKEDKFINQKLKDSYLNGIDDALNLINYLKNNIELCMEEEKEEFEKDEKLNLYIQDIESKVLKELSLKETPILEKEEDLENTTVLIIDFEKQTKVGYLAYAAIGDLIMAIIIIIIAATTKNNFVYIGLIAPVIIGAILFIILKKFKNSNVN